MTPGNRLTHAVFIDNGRVVRANIFSFHRGAVAKNNSETLD